MSVDRLIHIQGHELSAIWRFPFDPPIVIRLDGRAFAGAAPIRSPADQGWLIDWPEGDAEPLTLVSLATFLPEEIDSRPSMRAFALETVLGAVAQCLPMGEGPEG